MDRVKGQSIVASAAKRRAKPFLKQAASTERRERGNSRCKAGGRSLARLAQQNAATAIVGAGRGHFRGDCVNKVATSQDVYRGEADLLSVGGTSGSSKNRMEVRDSAQDSVPVALKDESTKPSSCRAKSKSYRRVLGLQRRSRPACHGVPAGQAPL